LKLDTFSPSVVTQAELERIGLTFRTDLATLPSVRIHIDPRPVPAGFSAINGAPE